MLRGKGKRPSKLMRGCGYRRSRRTKFLSLSHGNEIPPLEDVLSLFFEIVKKLFCVCNRYGPPSKGSCQVRLQIEADHYPDLL